MNLEVALKDSPRLVLDTSVYLAYFIDHTADIVPLLDTYVFSEDSPTNLFGHNILKAEIYYVTCRKLGLDKANDIITKMEGVLNLVEEIDLFKKAAQIKCQHSIALADCFTIATGIVEDCPALFLAEKELPKNVVYQINKAFSAKIWVVT
jgi:predicted nucleic acid-binding protein